MYHICSLTKFPRNDKRAPADKKSFYVVLLSENGEVLSTSETFTTKSKAFKNIIAQLDEMENEDGFVYVVVQDDTTIIPIIYRLSSSGQKWKPAIKPQPKYIPGKNINKTP